ncbi:50S ribosomal protein L20 [bioreactor metagenome]|uniref:50S ribosomal protein L20 n=1 Tax=bioreactor metagenome TaxID=1076179 RepID=A0A644UA12_9ZZZZ|nr:50S ribosomal protein L20 [Candidatus Elulimicrobiales bacterium]
MARVKGGKIANKHRRSVLKKAKGYRFGRSTKEKEAKVALRKAGVYAFAHRRDKKNDMRKLWNVKMNAALRPLGTTYSKFIDALKKKNIGLDRKILADLAENHPEVFQKVVESVK